MNSAPAAASINRRHDLDALRAIAMLSGIAFHASLSFIPGGWPVQDESQAPALALFPSFLHGFRMPLFFLISGFFTAMLWRKRGLKSLLWHRFKRIFIPFVICVFTIIPVSNYIVGWAITKEFTQSVKDGPQAAAPGQGDNLWSAAATGDLEKIGSLLDSGAPVNLQDQTYGVTPLSTAVMHGQAEAVKLLLERGANANAPVRDGSTPLHTAAFFGEAEIAQVLLDNGADVSIKNSYGQTPVQLLTVDMAMTEMIAGMVNVKFDPEKIQSGRREISEMMGQAPGASNFSPAASMLYAILFMLPVLMHLWFLWFLCWLVAGFAIYAMIADAMKWNVQSSKWILSPLRFVWLVPLTLVPQYMMSEMAFGPDTSAGVLPLPHMLFYYAIFFWFGALYFDAKDSAGTLGKQYWLTLPIAVLVIFPLSMLITYGSPRWVPLIPSLRLLLNNLLQVLYAWMMTFGCMGLFRQILNSENKTLRYASDSSYWLYITHLPLIIFAQAFVSDWRLPAMVKFVLILVVVTGFLLVIYDAMVRYSFIGAILNGRKRRAAVATAAV